MAKNDNLQVIEETYKFELPYGVKDEAGILHKEIELIEMNGVVDETIARPEIRTNIGKVVGAVIGVCLKRVGTLTPQKLGRTKWEKMITEMYMGDRDFIMFKLREITYGNELELNLQCPHCADRILHVVELATDIEIRQPQGDPDRIPFELPRGVKNKDGVLVTEGFMKLPTGFDQEQMDNMLRKNPGQANTTLLTRAVQELGDIELSSMIIRNLNKRDRDYLVQQLAESMFGPKMVLEINCPSCSEAFDTGVNPANFL
jgi:hypothetical protein